MIFVSNEFKCKREGTSLPIAPAIFLECHLPHDWHLRDADVLIWGCELELIDWDRKPEVGQALEERSCGFNTLVLT